MADSVGSQLYNSQRKGLPFRFPGLAIFRSEILLQKFGIEGAPVTNELPQSAIDVIAALTLERETLAEALQDSLCFYDRATGALRGDGWTAAETRRLAEIRSLAYGQPSPMAAGANGTPADAQTPPASYGKRFEAPKTPENGS